ncbi:MAG: hypothetical protein JO080_15380 [Mucilaginibacter sp.]|nr:hypothetical protein [Mucilaginibacter sp.]
MKKLLSILCCAVVLLSVSSCTKKYITPNPNETIYADVATSQWSTYSDGKSYDVPINVPQLDGGSAQYGGVIVSVSYDGGTTYEQLPEVYNDLSFSYTYNAGNVTIYAQTSAGTLPAAAPDPIKVKIILVASN